MKIQVSAIIGPILLLSFATRSTLADNAAISEDVATLSPSLDITTDVKHTQLSRGPSTAVKPEETTEVAGEDEAYKANDCDGEADEDQDADEYEEYEEYDEYNEYDEYDEDELCADDEDVELNGIDPTAYIDAAAQEADKRGNLDFNTQTEADTGVHPVEEDPLTESFSTCKPIAPSLHKRDGAPTADAPTAEDPADTPATSTQMDVSALATAEPGGACIDSFVNFALRFQDHCSIYCLKTYTHIFVKPNVLGILDCFGCSNFVVQGFIALGQDCVGLFTSEPMTPEDIRRAREAKISSIAVPVPTPTQGVKAKSVEMTVTGQADNGSNLRGAEPLNLDNVMQSLQSVDMDQVHEWLEIGKGIVSVINAGAKGSQTQEENQQQQPQGEIIVETQANEQGQVRAQTNEKHEYPKVNRDEFNEFIIKAAKFANWDLTPKMIDDSGVYDRVHESGVF